ncbi:MAG: transcriptional repressor [Deltaproteobacteria bacterium]|jgi:Fur family zinc uptake transcriptional regulator|nr:transcriptional repressor [Deltaproteobacteria bacterium]
MVLTDATLKSVLDQLADKCAEKGGHLTRLRRFLMGILLKKGQPVKAYDLIEESARLGCRLTPATVYRVLDFLMEHGLVHRVNALNSYLACSCYDPYLEHQPLLLVCPSCQKTTEINDPALSDLFFSKLEALGHSISDGSIEVRSRCSLCAEKP